MNRAFLTLVVSFGLGCSSAKEAVPCANNSDCAVGQACIQEECKPADCLSSAECALGEHCDESYTCTTGCDENTDCLAGQSCISNTCLEYGCRDTQLDCDYGEFCDPTTSTCYPDEAGTCEDCDPSTDANCFAIYEQGPCSSTGSCPTGQECYISQYDDSRVCRDDSDCARDETCIGLNTGSGTEGPYCSTLTCFSGATYPACDPTLPNECARGFQCQDIGGGEGLCFGDCQWLTENGHL
ncbi:MAG: hypothetical protein CL927_03145 [Deltaproteobacteria bacterium]|nr:hypothetical protein [Deltaproteobacteria bacterium]